MRAKFGQKDVKSIPAFVFKVVKIRFQMLQEILGRRVATLAGFEVFVFDLVRAWQLQGHAISRLSLMQRRPLRNHLCSIHMQGRIALELHHGHPACGDHEHQHHHKPVHGNHRRKQRGPMQNPSLNPSRYHSRTTLPQQPPD